MKLTANKLEEVNDKYFDNRVKKGSNKVGLGVNVDNSIKGLTVFMNNWEICTADELSQLIEELTIMKDTLTEETGVEF